MTDTNIPFFSRPLVRMGLVAAGAAVATLLVLALNSSVASRKAQKRTKASAAHSMTSGRRPKTCT